MKSRFIKPLLYILFILLFIACFIYLPEFKGRLVFKLLPSVVLLSYLLRLKGQDFWFMLSALLLCAAGDTFLDLNRLKFFMGGLVSFSLAHLVYFVYFLKSYKKPDKRRISVIIILLIYALVLGYFLRIVPTDLLIPVWVYLGIIILMSMAAIMASNVHYILYYGVIIFILSDTVLAVNKFIVPFQLATPLNIILYFSSQYCIVLGIVKSRFKV